MQWKPFIAGVITIIVLLALAGGGYYFGTKQSQKLTPLSQTSEATLPEEQSQTQTTPAPQPSPVPTTAPTTPVSAGGVLSFSAYTAQLPAGWEPEHDQDANTPIDRLTLTKGNYEISIYQAATGGAMCLYPGEAPFEGPSATYDLFAEIAGSGGVSYRRSGTTGDTAFTVCRIQDDGTYFQPTGFGHIQFKLPAGYDPKILAEMDSIIASLKQQ